MNHNKIRGEVVYRRTYSRPIGTTFETWEQTISRVIRHQTWLWERQVDRQLSAKESSEMYDLEQLLLSRKASTSGRTLWLGGTEVAMRREASQFNCSFLQLETVNDIVDQIWLLMQGCGVGFHPNVGILNGFTKKMEIQVIRSELKTKLEGVDYNEETLINGVWTLKVGDSAEAWAKTFGKLLAGKYNAHTLVFDFSNIRPAGERLAGYGWISSGDASLAKALPAIAQILNDKSGELLTRINLLDIGNWMGTVLSSRRSAEIAFHTFGDPETEEFIYAKKDAWDGNEQRYQSNNSLLFYTKPSKLELKGIFQLMIDSGGSEPGFINAAEALRRAPWFKGLNPCAEILLGNRSFCNLVELNLSAFNEDTDGLFHAQYLIGRANYRQTCVNLRDGVLQDAWHELNEFLRLTGMGVTGIVGWEHVNSPYMWKTIADKAREAVHSMADELGLPRSKAITTIKPSGTLSKMMGCTEGIHKPLGKYIFNHIIFAKADPLVQKLKDANYFMWENPRDTESMIVRFPVVWEDIPFESVEFNDRIVEVNQESAIVQLERYKMVQTNYTDHNCSITVSYDVSEVPAIVNWLDENWDIYVGVSWLFRDDPTKTAQDLGYDYLPQEVQTKEVWEEYANSITELDLNNTDSFEEISGEECSGGVCPIK